MKLATVILLAAIVQVSANGFAQRLTLKQENVSLNKVFKEIRKQTGYHVLWKPDKLNANTTISANFKNASLEKVMEQCLYGRGLTYAIDEKTIVIKPLPQMIQVAQEVITVTGTVTEKVNKLPLVGVNVISVENIKLRSVTDADGNFEIKVPANSRLLFKMLGFKDVTVVAKASISIEMEQMVNELEEVVIGYGTQKKDLVTGSVVTMKMDDTRRNSPTTSLGNLLAGQMAGVKVSNVNGRPGSAPSITIRTKNSYSNQDVLYVIDGLITSSGDFNNLSPNDVDNISVLKDAASTAAYGARASGGVVVVTTRRGAKNERAKINYSYNTGFDKRGRNAERTNAIEAGEIYNRINPTSPEIWTQADFDYFKNINNGWGYDQVEVVWQDPYTTTHNLSATGGGDKMSYYIGGSYVNQGAFQKNSEFKKYNVRANITADVAKNLTVFAGISANNNISDRLPFEGEGDLYRKQLLWQWWQPVWTDGGQPLDYGWIANIGSEIRGDGGYRRENYLKPVINLKATYKIPFVPGLDFSGQYIKAFTNSRSKEFRKKYNLSVTKMTGYHIISTKDEDIISTKVSANVSNEYLQENYTWNEDSQLNFQLNYDRTFAGEHHVRGWLAYERAEGNSGGVGAYRQTFPVYLTDQWWAASNDINNRNVVETKVVQPSGRKSYVGQFFYDYSSKYLASFTFRYDGSYKFPADRRWAFFPSASLGWVVSREGFFKDVRGIESLKIRASLGNTSSDNTNPYQYQLKYEQGGSTYFGTNKITNVGIKYGPLVNPDITWEKTRTFNIGADVNFLKHFNASAEYFYSNTYDIFVERVAQVPPTFSRQLPFSNYGRYKSEGVELSFGYRNKIDKVNYYVNVNASYANATPLMKDKNVTYPWDIEINQSASRQVGFVNTGMIRTQADLDAFKAANPKYKFNGRELALGQLTYADLSGKEGKPDGIVDDWDKTVIFKNTNPVSMGLNLGFEWKGISIDASFAGNLYNYKNISNLAGGVEWNRMWKAWAYDSWSPENTGASLPRRYGSNDGTKDVNNAPSTFWYRRADYLRLRLLNVGYSIPSKITNKIGINGLKFYFSGSNLFVISKFNKDYYDPEMGGGFDYPVMKNFNFGVNLSL